MRDEAIERHIEDCINNNHQLVRLQALFKALLDFGTYTDPTTNSLICVSSLLQFSRDALETYKFLDASKLLAAGMWVLRRDCDKSIVPLRRHVDIAKNRRIYIREGQLNYLN